MDPVSGWYDDPTGRHEHRYWDGAQWTERVRDQGTEARDPVAGPPADQDPTAGSPEAEREPEPEREPEAEPASGDTPAAGQDWALPGATGRGDVPSPQAPTGSGPGTPSSPPGGGELPPAGWYPDPSTRGQQRYWDGNQWTEHTHQSSGPSGNQGYASSGYAGGSGGSGAQAGYGTGGGKAQLNTWLIPSILATVFCCLPIGIVGIVYASRANSRLGEGNVVAAQEAADKARMWTWIAVGVGLVVAIFYAVAIATTGFMGSGF